MDANATNYNADATVQSYDQWGNLQCIYASCDDIPEYGCVYSDGFGAFNEGFDAAACESYGGIPCEANTTEVYGCTDENASNFNEDANVDDGSCTYPVLGCTDPLAFNYNPLANYDDLSCILPVYGCTDPLATNWNELANIDDNSCVYDEATFVVIKSIGTHGNQSPLHAAIDNIMLNIDGNDEFVDNLNDIPWNGGIDQSSEGWTVFSDGSSYVESVWIFTSLKEVILLKCTYMVIMKVYIVEFLIFLPLNLYYH